jgi:insulin-like growth factor-binding protein complex acid labile subunit
MKTFFNFVSVSVIAVLSLSASGHADVCSRTPQLVKRLEETVKKKCDQIEVSDLRKINVLTLDNLGLTSLLENDFQDLASLTLLSLHDNRLVTLPEGLFKNLSLLKSLDLSNNLLKSLPEGIFQGLTHLKYLNLHSERTRNSIRRLPAGVFRGLTQLESLHLGNIDLVELPSSLKDLSSLKSLALYGNAIEIVSEDAFAGLHRLETLYMFPTKNLSSLPENLFADLDGLQALWMGYGSLDQSQTRLPEGIFRNLASLKVLDLSYVNLDTLPGTIFSPLKALTKLHLAHTKLKALPEKAFQGLVAIKSLNLTENKELAQMPANIFQDLKTLEEIDLTGTPIAQIEGNWFVNQSLNSLARLDFDGCGLTSLPDHAFEGLPALKNVSLADNRLVAINPRAFDGVSKTLELIYLKNNPLAEGEIGLLARRLKGVSILY